MDIVNIDALKAQGRILDASDVDPNEDYFVLGKYTNKYTTDSFKYTKYPVWAIKAGDVMGVQSVTGLNTDNTDPFNPIVKISVDGVTITGEGTPASPLAVQTKYKVYTALLTQTGTNAPVATVLENTLGLNPTYYYDGIGVYRIEDLSGLFTNNKTFVLSTGTGGAGISININDVSTIEIDCINMFSGTVQDGMLVNAGFEIRVYN